MKRFPNGVDGQILLPAACAGTGCRRACASRCCQTTMSRAALVGGSLTTLLYMAQLAVISQDPWFSRVQSPTAADFVAIDLDPPEDVTFAQVLDVARWVRDELAMLGAPSFPKTSGSDGLHVFLPMPPDTPYEAGHALLSDRRDDGRDEASEAGDRGAHGAGASQGNRLRGLSAEHRRQDTRVRVQRARKRLGRRIDAGHAGTRSMPDSTGVTSRCGTCRTASRKVGDLWAGLRTSKPVDLRSVERYAGKSASDKRAKRPVKKRGR